jgi:protein-disulfide isomerase
MLCAPLLMGGACEKKPTKPDDTGAMAALDKSGSGTEAPLAADGPPDTTPLPGVDIAKLTGDKSATFYKLIGSLKSPCGKAQSLRASFTSDTSCKRAPFAVRYVVALLEDEATEQIARDEYAKKYEQTGTPFTFDTSHAPRAGAEDARIKFVEFFDYECPHCAAFRPLMDQVIANKGDSIAVYYMMFPIESKHPDARGAAQAALAANAQGKFKEMHEKLFEASPKLGRDAINGYAQAMGLDMAKFAAAYDAAGPQVTADVKQGDDAQVDSTPTLFFNGRKYEGPKYPKYIEMWIDEELAVNR